MHGAAFMGACIVAAVPLRGWQRKKATLAALASRMATAREAFASAPRSQTAAASSTTDEPNTACVPGCWQYAVAPVVPPEGASAPPAPRRSAGVRIAMPVNCPLSTSALGRDCQLATGPGSCHLQERRIEEVLPTSLAATDQTCLNRTAGRSSRSLQPMRTSQPALPYADLSPATAARRSPLEQRRRRANLCIWMTDLQGAAS